MRKLLGIVIAVITIAGVSLADTTAKFKPAERPVLVVIAGDTTTQMSQSGSASATGIELVRQAVNSGNQVSATGMATANAILTSIAQNSATGLASANASLDSIELSQTPHGDGSWTAGPYSATTTGTAIFAGGRSLAVTIDSAGGTGASIFCDVSNAGPAPNVNDPTLWHTILKYVTLQAVGGEDGAVDPNAFYIVGYRWVKFRLEVAPVSAVTINAQTQN